MPSTSQQKKKKHTRRPGKTLADSPSGKQAFLPAGKNARRFLKQYRTPKRTVRKESSNRLFNRLYNDCAVYADYINK